MDKIEKSRASARNWARKNMSKVTERTLEYRKKNREKRNAWNQASYHVKLEGNCVHCKINLAKHRHHPDYSKPIYVLLLCEKCHKEQHKKEKELKLRIDSKTTKSNGCNKIYNGKSHGKAFQLICGLTYTCKDCRKSQEVKE